MSDHYRQGVRETWDTIEDVLGLEGALAFDLGNVIKYADRYRHKGDPVPRYRKID